MPLDGGYLENTSQLTRVLTQGRKRLEMGWCQNAYQKDRAVCLLGALRPGDPTIIRQAERIILSAIINCGYLTTSIAHCNDSLCRSQEDALAIYDEAIILSLLLGVPEVSRDHRLNT
jgi:hypothetical protein